MARIRNIKPEYWVSERVCKISPISALVNIALWSFMDDYGHIPYKPHELNLLTLPGRGLSTVEFDALIQELIDVGLLRMYVVDGKRYLEAAGWRHQKIYGKPTKRWPHPGEEGDAHSPDLSVNNSMNTAEQYELDPSYLIGKGVRDRDISVDGSLRSPSTSLTEVRKQFDEFWTNYPRKVGKARAMKAFGKALKLAPFETIIAGVQHLRAEWKPRLQAKPDEIQFVPHPSTWLNGERWEDYSGLTAPDHVLQGWRGRVLRWLDSEGKFWEVREEGDYPPDHPQTKVPGEILDELGVRQREHRPDPDSLP